MANKMFCSVCNRATYPKRVAAGSLIAEIAVWVAGLCIAAYIPFVIVGPIAFSLYRFFNRPLRCEVCKSTALISMDSEAAKAVTRR